MNNGKKKLTAVAVSAVLSLSVIGLTWQAAAESHGSTRQTVATQWPPAQGSSVSSTVVGKVA
ncbi:MULTISPECIES: hypothetical protein [unclassified Streptomyces]|uniref:hypothetical protein n=1 Tax=unclassified Streptomyces TaxID=2593676 RepID=UPI002E232386|nr:hypothetical protein OG217_27345 [Streptomyces sp. NBC_01023]